MTEQKRVGSSRARTTRRGIAWAVGVLAVAALLVGGLWWYNSTQAVNREQAIIKAVEGFYGAIAEADAPRAVGYVAGSVPPDELITSEVLAVSREAAPITGVRVGAVSAAKPYDTATAEVFYTIGDKEVTTAQALSRDGLTWKIDDALTPLTVSGTRGFTVNGVDPTQTTHQVLPGTYTAAPISEMLALDGTRAVTVASTGGAPTVLTVTPVLSEMAVTDVTTAAKNALKTCLESRVSAPPGCPWVLNEKGATVKPGSVRYALVNDPWKAFKPTLDLATMTARSPIKVKIEATAAVTFEGRTGQVTAPIEFDSKVVSDLTSSPLPIAWTS